MRHPILSTTLLLVLAGGVALADDDEEDVEDVEITETTTTTTKSPPQPAAMDIYFDTASADVTTTDDASLQDLANWAKCKSTHIIKLSGHADPRGTAEYNAELAANRAKAVTEKLVELGAPRDRIVVTVFGELGSSKATLDKDRRVSAVTEKEPAIVGSR